MTDKLNMSDKEQLDFLAASYKKISDELGKVIIGQNEVIRHLLISLFSGGHSLLVGVPGLAKTLLIRTLSEALELSFNRIQFTPDLMPSDITGTEILEENPETGLKNFRFIKGPLFAQVVLADEINRTPPKTQAALLQAMQEFEVSSGGKTYDLKPPFFVLATQNPIEQEGTYPLPEAQLDRFMFEIQIDYPTANEEYDIVASTTFGKEKSVKPVMNGVEILKMQSLVRNIPIAQNVIEYAVNLVRMTRANNGDAPQFVKDWVRWGAGPRAGQYLVLGAKASAALDGRTTPEIEDVRKLAYPVLRHRVVRTFRAEADNVSTEDIINRLLEI